MSSLDDEARASARSGHLGRKAKLVQYERDLAHLPKWLEAQKRTFEKERSRLVETIKRLKAKG